MNTTLARQAIKLFPSHITTSDKSQRRHLQRGWLRAVEILGDRWISRKLIEKKEATCVA